MFKFWFTKQGGVISVMLSIVLIAVLGLGSSLAEAARYNSAKAILHEADINAGYSLLANYDKDLLDKYGLLAIQQDKDNEQLTKLYKKYMKANLGGLQSEEDKNAVENMLNGLDDKSVAEGCYSLNENSVLQRELLETMKYRAPINFVGDTLSQFADSFKSLTETLNPLKTLISDSLDVVNKITATLTKVKTAYQAAKKLSDELKDYKKVYGELCALIAKKDELKAKVGPEPQQPEAIEIPDEPEEPLEADFIDDADGYKKAKEDWEKDHEKWEKKKEKIEKDNKEAIKEYKKEHKKWEKKNKDYFDKVKEVEKKVEKYQENITKTQSALSEFQIASNELASAAFDVATSAMKAYMDKEIEAVNKGKKQKETELGKMKEDDPDYKTKKESIDKDKETKEKLDLTKSYISELSTDSDTITEGINYITNNFILKLKFDKEKTYLQNTAAEDLNKSTLASKHTNVNINNFIDQLGMSFLGAFVKSIFNLVKSLWETIKKMASVMALAVGGGLWDDPRYSVSIDKDTYNNLSSRKVPQGASNPSTKSSDRTKATNFIREGQDIANQVGYDINSLSLGKDESVKNMLQKYMQQMIDNMGIVIENVNKVINAGNDLTPSVFKHIPGIGKITDIISSLAKVITFLSVIIPTFKAMLKVAEASAVVTVLMGNNIFEMMYDSFLLNSYVTNVFTCRTSDMSDSNVFGCDYTDMARGSEYAGLKQDAYNGILGIQAIANMFKANWNLEPVANIIKPNQKVFAKADVEYVLGGSRSETQNQRVASQAIFCVRFIANCITVLTSENEMKIIEGTGVFFPLTYILFVLGEAAIDEVFITNDVAVALVKIGDEKAFLSGKSLDDLKDKGESLAKNVLGSERTSVIKTALEKNGFIEKEVEKKDGKKKKTLTDMSKEGLEGLFEFGYDQYMWCFLSIIPKSLKTSRIGDLVEMHMNADKKAGDTPFKMSKGYTYVRTNAIGEYQPLIPIAGLSGTYKPESISYTGY